MSEFFDVAVGEGTLENGARALCLKLTSDAVEINVWFTPAEAASLGQVLALGAEAPGLRLGICANSPVHWGRDDGRHVYVMVGDDDETWDFGVTLSDAAFHAVLEEIARQLGK